jgi:hypothetical protein
MKIAANYFAASRVPHMPENCFIVESLHYDCGGKLR